MHDSEILFCATTVLSNSGLSDRLLLVVGDTRPESAQFVGELFIGTFVLVLGFIEHLFLHLQLLLLREDRLTLILQLPIQLHLLLV